MAGYRCGWFQVWARLSLPTVPSQQAGQWFLSVSAACKRPTGAAEQASAAPSCVS